jgi:hypothetical protein
MRPILIASFAVAFVAFLVGIGMYANARSARPPVFAGEADYDRIENGITQEDVEAILGGPPGDYRTQSYPINFHCGSWGPPSGRMEEWLGNDGNIWVVFDEENKVVWKGHPNVSIRLEPPTLVERVRAKLGL